MNIIEKPLGELAPYENNPRRISADAVNAVAESIRQFGFKVPIVIDASGVIVCGHTRYQAAQSLGLASVPCIVADDLTPEQVKAFRLADNKTAELTAWDFSALEAELDALSGAFDMDAFGFDMTDGENALESDEGYTDEFTLPNGDRRPITEISFTFSDDEAETVKEAIRVMKRSDAFKDYENPLNQNSNGNALFLVVSEWLAQRI